MSKKSNFDKFFDLLENSGFDKLDAQRLYNAVKEDYNSSYGGKPDIEFADYIDAMPDAYFYDFVQNVARPRVKSLASEWMRNNRDSKNFKGYEQNALKNFLQATSNVKTREQFLTQMGRQPSETVDPKTGVVKKGERYIGELSQEDRDNLELEGYDVNQIDGYADLFRRKYGEDAERTMTRERFLDILGREGRDETDVFGDTKKNVRHIGRLTPEDYAVLQAHDISPDVADRLADKFRAMYQKGVSEEENAKMKGRMNDARRKVVDDYQKSFVGGLAKTGFPELYAEGVKAGLTGKYADDDGKSVGGIPSSRFKGALARDLGRNAALVGAAAVGGAMGGLGGAAATGMGVAASEYSFDRESPNYESDFGRSVSAGTLAGTMPAGMNWLASKAMGIPYRPLQLAVKNSMKKYRRGVETGTTLEKNGALDFVDDVAATYAAAKIPGTGVRVANAHRKVGELVERMNASPVSVADKTSGSWTHGQVERLLSTEEGVNAIRKRVATPPTRKEYVAQTDVMKAPKPKLRNYKGEVSKASQEKLQKYYSDKRIADEWLDQAQKAWPMHTDSYANLPTTRGQTVINKIVDGGFGSANSALGVIEPMTTRASGSPFLWNVRGDQGFGFSDWRDAVEQELGGKSR